MKHRKPLAVAEGRSERTCSSGPDFGTLPQRAGDSSPWRRSMLLGLVVISLAWPGGAQAAGEERFGSPQAAVDALKAAAEARDTNALHKIFGPVGQALVSEDMVQASTEREIFMRHVNEKVNLVADSDSKQELLLGAGGWPFPIPLVKDGGQWHFDTQAGTEEILNRRIGANELGAIAVCRAYVQAQREYTSTFHDDSEVLEYAQHLRSTPGKHDGLFWPTQTGDDLSPLGPLVAQAHFEGYRQEKKILTDAQSPYHGYYFRIMTQQGGHAAGGAYSYIINGHMIAGFALVAWPAEWDNTGVMTFIVNQHGKVYQKNLGPETASLAGEMTTFDPDSSWALTKTE